MAVFTAGRTQLTMLTELLRRKRSRILSDWTEIIFRAYPEQTATFMREQKDRFANPVGYAVSREVPRFLDLLIDGEDIKALAASLDRFIQIKSVQEAKASVALSFVFDLKSVIRGHAGGEAGPRGDLDALEDKLDRAALAVFDIYQGYREKILEIKANEIRNRSKILLERMNLGDEPGGMGCSVLEGIPDAPGSETDAGENKGGNDR
jgi:hypothetical protein